MRKAQFALHSLGFQVAVVLMLLQSVTLKAQSYSAESAWPGSLDCRLCRHPALSSNEPVIPCVIRKVKLGGVNYWAKLGIQPDTSLAFSPDGRKLAIGSFLGDVQVLDVYAGTALWSKRIAQAIIKNVAFSGDGKILYFGEQSVDAFFYAVDATSGKLLWRVRLADDIKPGTPARNGSPYAIYQQPCCFRICAFPDAVLVLGVHSWGEHIKVEQMQRLSRIYKFSKDGQLLWAVPSNAPIPLTIADMATDAQGRIVAFLTGAAAANTPANTAWKPFSLYVVDGRNGTIVGRYQFEPLRPYFDEVGFWRSLAISKAGTFATVGLFDGRAFVFSLAPFKQYKVMELGTPIEISGVPVCAPATYTHIASDGTAYFQTGSSSVPYAARKLRVVEPPGPHPMANMIHAASCQGEIKWRFHSGHQYQGFWTSEDGRWLATCVIRQREDSLDAGAMLFDTHRPGGGLDKFLYYYQVEGLTFFNAAMAPDGSAFAFVEVPYIEPQTERLKGTYQVHIIR